MSTGSQTTLPLINDIIHSIMFQTTPHSDKTLSQLDDVMDSGMIHMLLHGSFRPAAVFVKNWPLNFSRPTKVGQQKIFSNVFENTTTYRWKLCTVIGRCLLFETSRLWNDAVKIKLIKIYKVNQFLCDPGDPNWVLSINMMICTFSINGLQA